MQMIYAMRWFKQTLYRVLSLFIAQAHHRQTDKQTDRQTDRQVISIAEHTK